MQAINLVLEKRVDDRMEKLSRRMCGPSSARALIFTVRELCATHWDDQCRMRSSKRLPRSERLSDEYSDSINSRYERRNRCETVNESNKISRGQMLEVAYFLFSPDEGPGTAGDPTRYARSHRVARATPLHPDQFSQGAR